MVWFKPRDSVVLHVKISLKSWCTFIVPFEGTVVGGYYVNIESWSKIRSGADVKVFIWYRQKRIYPQIFFKSTRTGINSGNTEKVCKTAEKKLCCTLYHDFGAFLRHFAFWAIIDNFSTFFRKYVQPRKNFKKVGNLRIYDPVFDLEKILEIFFFKKSIFRRVVTGFFILIIFPERCIFLRW